MDLLEASVSRKQWVHHPPARTRRKPGPVNPILKGLRTTVAAVAIAGLMQSVGSIAFGALAGASNTQLMATTAVNVRAAASGTSARLGVLYRGERVQAVTSSNGWTTVTYQGKTGYVATSYLSASSVVVDTPSTPSKKGTVYSVATLNLRSGPALSDAVKQVVTKGAKLSLTGTVSGSYSQVVYNSDTLWAATSYLATSVGAPSQSLPATTGKVQATAALMIRTTNDRNFMSLGDVARGTILEVTGVLQGGLAQVLWQGNVRWVNNSYVTRIEGATAPVVPVAPGTTTQYATANLNVWSAATGTVYSGEIAHGSAVQVTGAVVSGRAEIVVNGAVRWVTAKYLSASKPSAPGTGSGGSGSGSLNHGYSSGLDQTNDNIKKVVRHVWANYPAIKTMYGWRRDVTPDHPAGRAVDVMIPNYKSNNAMGWQIAEYFRANASEFNITYIIFDQKIWSVSRDKDGWRSMAGRGGDTANHKDHVHINA